MPYRVPWGRNDTHVHVHTHVVVVAPSKAVCFRKHGWAIHVLVCMCVLTLWLVAAEDMQFQRSSDGNNADGAVMEGALELKHVDGVKWIERIMQQRGTGAPQPSTRAYSTRSRYDGDRTDPLSPWPLIVDLDWFTDFSCTWYCWRLICFENTQSNYDARHRH
jgi:hypothetical protein